MTDLPLLQTRHSALLEARAGGQRRIRFKASTGEEREVEYKSDSELAAAIADIEQRIAAASNPPARTITLFGSKGL